MLYDMSGALLQRFQPATEPTVEFSDDSTHIDFKPKNNLKDLPRHWNIAAGHWEDSKASTRYANRDGEQVSPDGRWDLVRLEKPASKSIQFILTDVVKNSVLKQWENSIEETPDIFFDPSLPRTDALIVVFSNHCERWELPALTCAASFPIEAHHQFSPDGRWVANVTPATNRVVIRDAKTGIIRREFPHEESLTSMKDTRIRFSPDGEDVFLMDESRSVAQLWNIATQAKIVLGQREPTQGTRVISRLSLEQEDTLFTKDGKRIEAYSGAGGPILTAWDRKTGAMIYEGQYMAHSLDGQEFCVIDRGGRELLYPPSTEPLATFSDYEEFSFLTDPDRILARPMDVDNQSLHILARFRPEAWWGIAWLPEFWMTLLFAGLFGWNLFRSRFSR